MDVNVPVTILKGIGEKTAKTLEKMKIVTVDDLIHYYPRDYEIKKEFCKIADMQINETYLVEADVSQAPFNLRKKNMILTKMKVKDDTGVLEVTWFRQPYMQQKFSINQKVILKGKVTIKQGKKEMTSPQVLHEEERLIQSSQQLYPIYPLTKNISLKQMSEWINEGLNYTTGQLVEYLPLSIKNRFNLCEYNFALNQIHNPEDELRLSIAKKRLIFDEFLIFQLSLQMLKQECYIMDNQYEFSHDHLVSAFIDHIPFQLTNAQKKVWSEIKDDLTGNKTMNRLVQGDVGSGKTIVAILSLLLAVENNYQGTLMAPTEVLAKQHYQSLNSLLEPFNIKIGLLVGSMTKKEKNIMAEQIHNGTIQIVIGTHAIIQEPIQFNNLAIVITDEQHRFGVKQREKLAGKGHFPHVLVMSATPIPRTLALIVYGDMDVSIIDELPPGRQSIETYSVNSSYRSRIYAFLEKEIQEGRQCYIVCPAVEENDTLEIESVILYTEKLKEVLSQTIRIAYLHGKMKPKEKNEIMENFANGLIDVLVSTTVIEVGINVPNATLMVIENAERFGLAGLHQLRGRVGRGKHQSYCILITDAQTTQTKKRMEVLEKYTDGFIISEYDLKLRGPGDAFGIKQHGLPEFRIGDIFENIDILKVTHELAKELLSNDALLKGEEYKHLNNYINQNFRENLLQIPL